jgi:hypothetical protein
MNNQIMAIVLGFCLTLMADTHASYAEKELPAPAQFYVGIFEQIMPRKSQIGDRIEFQAGSGRLYLNYEGVAYFEEHGTGHYFHTEQVILTENGNFSFTVPNRTFYSAPLRSGKFLTIRGYETEPMTFSGKLEDGKLVLSCQSKDKYACYDKQLIFQRIK